MACPLKSRLEVTHTPCKFVHDLHIAEICRPGTIFAAGRASLLHSASPRESYIGKLLGRGRSMSSKLVAIENPHAISYYSH